MAIRDDADVHVYVDPAWLPGSSWTFKLYKLKPDITAIGNLAYEYQVPRYTPKQIREAKRKGVDLTAEIDNAPIEARTLMDPQLAELTHMSVEWSGPEFIVPATFKARDAEGKVIVNADGTPVLHELAGKPAPCTLEWIARVEPEQLQRVYDHMSRVWEGGDESDEDFRQAGASVDQPEPAGSPEAGSGSVSA